jgi:transcriptional regulator GlxA family with amidase domain
VFGSTPAEFVETLRVNEAGHRLSVPKRTIDTIAASVGFCDAKAFRPAFERRLGVKPRKCISIFDSASVDQANGFGSSSHR